jgi:hypothetical protein
MTDLQTQIVTYGCILLGFTLLHMLATFIANRLRVKEGRDPVPYAIPWIQLFFGTLGFWGAYLFRILYLAQ